MEDFEWKLREVEGGYKTKIKTLEEGLESKVTFLQPKSFRKLYIPLCRHNMRFNRITKDMTLPDPPQHAGDHTAEGRGADEDVHRRAEGHGGEAEEGEGQSEGLARGCCC